MNIKDIKIPSFTDTDLEWINNQPWFDILIDNNILARYGTFTPTSLCEYPKRPYGCKYEKFCRHDSPVSEHKDIDAQFNQKCREVGFQIIGKGLEYGGTVDSSKIKLFLCYETPVYGQACGIGYCKQFDCNIGFTACGKWMEDSNIFLLPKDFHTPEFNSIQENGIWIGNDLKIQIHNITKHPELRTRDFIYKLR